VACWFLASNNHCRRATRLDVEGAEPDLVGTEVTSVPAVLERAMRASRSPLLRGAPLESHATASIARNLTPMTPPSPDGADSRRRASPLIVLPIRRYQGAAYLDTSNPRLFRPASSTFANGVDWVIPSNRVRQGVSSRASTGWTASLAHSTGISGREASAPASLAFSENNRDNPSYKDGGYGSPVGPRRLPGSSLDSAFLRWTGASYDGPQYLCRFPVRGRTDCIRTTRTRLSHGKRRTRISV
jgi:hypothetical protein